MIRESLPACSEKSNLPAFLSYAARQIEGLGDEYAVLSRQLGALRERLCQGRLHLAVLGQFKRGKSTLLNALLGESVLPTAVVPLTAIPTFVRSGPRLAGRVEFQNGREAESFTGDGVAELQAFLSRFVTEEGNPKNKLGVLQVEVVHPAPILAKGVVLIDTPGIGSTFRHNTEATLNFLPQCDAALFLISADPPVTEVEVAFLKQVRKKVPRLFFIFNKADYLSGEERHAALAFLRKVLTEQAGIAEDTPVFFISAKQGLEASMADDLALWRRSGMEEVERHLVQFLASEKSEALQDAVGRKAFDVLGDVLMRLRLAIRSLEMPLEDLERRLGTFERKIAEIQHQRLAAADLLTGERRRIQELLEEQAKNLRAKARKYLDGVVQNSLAGNGSEILEEKLLQEALEEAIPGYFEHEIGATTEFFRNRVAEVLRPHQNRADQLIETIRRTAAELFEISYTAPESDRAFESVRQPYWVTRKWSSTLTPIPEGALDRLLPAGIRNRRIQKRLKEQIAALVLYNVENLRWATLQNINDTFGRFGSELDERLADTMAATHGAICAAIDRRRDRSEAVAPQVARLGAIVNELSGIQAKLKDMEIIKAQETQQALVAAGAGPMG